MLPNRSLRGVARFFCKYSNIPVTEYYRDYDRFRTCLRGLLVQISEGRRIHTAEFNACLNLCA